MLAPFSENGSERTPERITNSVGYKRDIRECCKDLLDCKRFLSKTRLYP